MKQLKKSAALLLAVILLFSLSAPAVMAEENTVTIKTVDDLLIFSKNCTLDTWSQGKTVNLEADLDLRNTEFSPIPSFSGTFCGNGHTISGLTLTGSGNVRGLFRYLCAGATVQDLTVKGSLRPDGRQNALGLLAGSNAGQILRCEAGGVVLGDNRIGGLVGVNETSGTLSDCRFSGSVTGKHFAGGIVGENLGTVLRCENTGSINAKNLEDDPRTDYSNLAQLNSMENVSAYTDIGGIAGLSSGPIQSCKNTGTVGYDQIGYNIGGIAGRQSGWTDDCVNTGVVSGRTDVGGIAGQLEPEIIKSYSNDLLDDLLDETDALQNLLDRTLQHGSDITGSVHTQLDQISQQTRTVKEQAESLTDALTDWANDSIDQINELSDRIDRALDQLDDVMDDAVSLTRALNDLTDETAQLNQDLKQLSNALSAMGDLGSFGDISDLSDIEALLRSFASALLRLSNAANRALNQLDDVNDALDTVVDRLQEATVGLRDVVDDLADEPAIKIDPIGPEITEKSDALRESVDALLDSGDALNDLLQTSANTIDRDLQAINDQFRSITARIRQARADQDEKDRQNPEERLDNYIQDLSSTCDPETQRNAHISRAQNLGSVFGNSNVGGIVGTIGIERDFTVEDDVSKTGDYSLNFLYQARALLSSCVNSGEIIGQSDCAGGIAGLAELGRITGCEGYGSVSAGGNYAGGIAGRSRGSADLCWAKCAISGEDYVGGIAGFADSLTNCRSLVTISGSAYLGAVAGDVDEDGLISANRFTHETLGGIDGISHAGKTDPVSFDVLCGDTAPQAFTELVLTFRAGGQTLAVIPFAYGQGIDTLPQIPAKSGCSAAWPDLDYTHLTASQTLDAVYTPYGSALAENSGADLPQILIDGSFSPRAEISHTVQPVAWTEENGTEHSGDAVTVTVTDPDLTVSSYTVHYRLPDSGKRYALWVETETGWQKQECTLDGSYLLIPAVSASITFCILEANASGVLWLAALAAALVILFLILAVSYRKRQKRKLLCAGETSATPKTPT